MSMTLLWKIPIVEGYYLCINYSNPATFVSPVKQTNKKNCNPHFIPQREKWVLGIESRNQLWNLSKLFLSICQQVPLLPSSSGSCGSERCNWFLAHFIAAWDVLMDLVVGSHTSACWMLPPGGQCRRVRGSFSFLETKRSSWLMCLDMAFQTRKPSDPAWSQTLPPHGCGVALPQTQATCSGSLSSLIKSEEMRKHT